MGVGDQSSQVKPYGEKSVREGSKLGTPYNAVSISSESREKLGGVLA